MGAHAKLLRPTPGLGGNKKKEDAKSRDEGTFVQEEMEKKKDASEN